jgi:hypothetical protein
MRRPIRSPTAPQTGAMIMLQTEATEMMIPDQNSLISFATPNCTR